MWLLLLVLSFWNVVDAMARFNDRQSSNETNNNTTITTIKGNALQKTTNR